MHVAHKNLDQKNDEPYMQWHVPVDMVMKVAAFCQELQQKFPHMKTSRIARKAAAHFGLKEKMIKKDVTN